MKDLSIKEFSDYMYEKLEDLGYEIILTNITTESKFPCIEFHTPLKSVIKTQDAFPLFSTFQMQFTTWANKQREAMAMSNELEEKLRELNLVRTTTSEAIHDEITKKYGVTSTFEVRYNSITHSFDVVM